MLHLESSLGSPDRGEGKGGLRGDDPAPLRAATWQACLSRGDGQSQTTRAATQAHSEKLSYGRGASSSFTRSDEAVSLGKSLVARGAADVRYS